MVSIHPQPQPMGREHPTPIAPRLSMAPETKAHPPTSGLDIEAPQNLSWSAKTVLNGNSFCVALMLISANGDPSVKPLSHPKH